MLIHPTVERLRSLGLAAMADTLVELQNNPEAAEMSHADWLGLLIDREATFRDNRRLSRRLTAAKLRQTATIENIDFRSHVVSIDLSFRHSRPANGYVTATTWPSSAQPEQGSPGWLAPSATKPAATVSPSSINERRASLPTSPRRAAKVVFLA